MDNISCIFCKYFLNSLTRYPCNSCIHAEGYPGFVPKEAFNFIDRSRNMEKCTGIKPMSSNETFDRITPGALIGKFVKYNGEKYMVVGDHRLHATENKREYPIVINHEVSGDVVKPEEISPWTEPKPKKLIALYLAKDNEDGDYLIPEFLQTEEKAKLICDLNRWTLIKWPAPGIEPIEVDDE